MKTTRCFVAATNDGQFLYIGERGTHTGYHVDVGRVADIEKASVFPTPRFTHRGVYTAVPEHTWVPVEVRREVVLLGYGIEGGSK